MCVNIQSPKGTIKLSETFFQATFMIVDIRHIWGSEQWRCVGIETNKVGNYTNNHQSLTFAWGTNVKKYKVQKKHSFRGGFSSILAFCKLPIISLYIWHTHIFMLPQYKLNEYGAFRCGTMCTIHMALACFAWNQPPPWINFPPPLRSCMLFEMLPSTDHCIIWDSGKHDTMMSHTHSSGDMLT